MLRNKNAPKSKKAMHQNQNGNAPKANGNAPKSKTAMRQKAKRQCANKLQYLGNLKIFCIKNLKI
ncbi:MAG: hypothetical protein RR123_06165 [Clostridia bacterium]